MEQTCDLSLEMIVQCCHRVAGWLGCLLAVDVVALLVWEATKLTLGQDLIIKVPHEVNTLLQGDPP